MLKILLLVLNHWMLPKNKSQDGYHMFVGGSDETKHFDLVPSQSIDLAHFFNPLYLSSLQGVKFHSINSNYLLAK